MNEHLLRVVLIGLFNLAVYGATWLAITQGGHTGFVLTDQAVQKVTNFYRRLASNWVGKILLYNPISVFVFLTAMFAIICLGPFAYAFAMDHALISVQS